MEQDQTPIKNESNGPNPPTQVDKVSTSEAKPDAAVTELNKPEPDLKKDPDVPPPHEDVMNGMILINTSTKLF
jgi:hypothetical protein